ncbi:hypothetical protein C0Q70_21665 [Pomacea canaliculata]|uniref:Uncharacterized protein n=1 Tax=Pomacea canaliculata TaxID=400727 RepID=A0A2T7ND56_POMCA|nr:hypothetical protein C0Q70_21665 [Pomacea canaliculata]
MHHEELLMKAADLLARAEEDGGRLISQMLLDQDFSHNEKCMYQLCNVTFLCFDPLVETQWKRFVEQLIANLKALGAELGDGGTRVRLGRSSHGNVILPNGIFIPGLDFNDILDILGGYGKGLYSLLIPVLTRRGRDVGTTVSGSFTTSSSIKSCRCPES